MMWMFRSLTVAALVVSAAGSSTVGFTRADDRPAVGTRSIPYSTFVDRLRGGWAGQMVGVSYGSIYEFKALGKTYDGPIRTWKPGYIENSLGQDDIYVEMTFLKTLEAHGLAPSPAQIGADFRDSKYELWHANMAARTNLRAGILPPDSGHPRFNPHSDDIDFQIEADLFGLIAPGMPRAATRMAEPFGRMMNYGDGLYGGYVLAAMYSQAYLEDEPTPGSVERCVEAGLASIPGESTYAKLLRDVLTQYRTDPADWRAAWSMLEAKYGNDDTCPEGHEKPFNIDAKLNGGYVVIGLLYGRGDFARTLEISTRCGQDADCNPASAAGVLGTLYGFRRIPSEYTSGIAALQGKRFAYTDYDY